MDESGNAKTLSEAAYDLIRRDVISGALEPDSKLRIEVLRDHYGVGASPLREALNRLAAEGFVVAIGQRGFRVAPMSGEELRDITRLRILLETEALKESITAGDDDWESGVVAAYHRLAKADAKQAADFNDWEKRNHEFHETLVGACSSPLLLRFRSSVYDQHKRYRSLAIFERSSKRDLAAEHQEIKDAALARDAERACRATERHIRLTAEETERIFAKARERDGGALRRASG